ncbi:MAG: hypothetical protein V1752_00630 [Candidatus Firestonebacteria bacterium]
MIKKTGVFVFLVFVFLLLVGPNENSVFSAESKTGKSGSNFDADQLKKLSYLTGLASSQISKYGLNVDTVLRIYAAAAVSGSSFQVVYENSEEGVNIPAFYKKYSVSVYAQTTAAEKYNKLRAELVKTEETKQTYADINKEIVAEVMSKKTGISRGAILDYGFGAGIPVNDILTCCVIASKSGNSLSNIVEKRKQGGSIESVYTSLSIPAQKRSEILTLVNSFREEVSMAGKIAGKETSRTISGDMKSEAAKLSDIAGVSEDSILEAMKKGDSSGDIIRALAVTKKVGGSFSSILEIKREGGWGKVNSHFGVGNIVAQADITRIINEINDKIKPPPSPIEKRELK